jgi:glycosyltransferase involved in cell wall biosynthesis
MRILLVHNAYQQRGGEDSVVDAEVSMLRDRGHNVELFFRKNDDINTMGRVHLVRETLWSQRAQNELTNHIAQFIPDIVHVHNTFPLISPSIYWAAAQQKIPVVQTLHNFRLLCPQAMFLREGRVCEKCLGRLPLPGIIHGCYRESRSQTTVLTGMLTLHRAIGTWQNKVTRYIALNEFCRQKFIDGGLPAARIAIKPNFVDFPAPQMQSRSGFLFVGRLSAEKGISVLAEAATLVAADIRVAGVGPESHLLNDLTGITRLGELSGQEVREQMGRAMALILPSIWYENFPRTLVEALGCGLPVIASRIGALAELVQDGVTGLLFSPGDSQSLAEKMNWALANPEAMSRMGLAARATYERLYTADRNYEQLLSIYRDAYKEVKGKTLNE